jgi:2,4-dienoyl-CoA reductase (NADPH2)
LDLKGGETAPDYAQVLAGRVLGASVAVIGAGGIGFDVATALVGAEPGLTEWQTEWGLGDPDVTRGGLAEAVPEPPARQVWLLQRKAETPGRRGLGKTTGWIHRAHLTAKGVRMLGGVEYLGFGPEGLRIRRDGRDEVLPVDDIVLCTGQQSERALAEALAKAGQSFHLIGGAADADQIDAKRAIEEGVRLGLIL